MPRFTLRGAGAPAFRSFSETIVHLREITKRANNRPGDQVRVRSFTRPLSEILLIRRVLVQDLDGDAPLRSRRRNREAQFMFSTILSAAPRTARLRRRAF